MDNFEGIHAMTMWSLNSKEEIQESKREIIIIHRWENFVQEKMEICLQ